MTTDTNTQPLTETSATALEPEHIDQLMAAPIPERPKIIVVGDDAVTGINPAPYPPA